VNQLERNNSNESDEQQQQFHNNNNLDNAISSTTVAVPSNEDTATPLTNQYYNNPHSMYNNYYYGTSGNNQNTFYNAPTNQHPQQHLTSTPYNVMNHSHQQQQQHQQQQLMNNCYYPQNYAVNHMNYVQITTGINNNMACDDFSSDKSKSRSVPDIIKELNDELNNSQKRRIRNHSQNNHSEVIAENESENLIFLFIFKVTNNFNLILAKSNASIIDDQLMKLPERSQVMAKNICQMGFHKEMVVRALIRMGEVNDKKIIDHLISLSELLQMGFEEERISDALIKFDNNKDEALDYLIS
jgi:hypothetical protein